LTELILEDWHEFTTMMDALERLLTSAVQGRMLTVTVRKVTPWEARALFEMHTRGDGSRGSSSTPQLAVHEVIQAI
jgi:hypothetical protein